MWGFVVKLQTNKISADLRIPPQIEVGVKCRSGIWFWSLRPHSPRSTKCQRLTMLVASWDTVQGVLQTVVTDKIQQWYNRWSSRVHSSSLVQIFSTLNTVKNEFKDILCIAFRPPLLSRDCPTWWYLSCRRWQKQTCVSVSSARLLCDLFSCPQQPDYDHRVMSEHPARWDR